MNPAPMMTDETPLDEQQILQDDLQRHRSALSRLQNEMIASRLEVAGARGETVQFQAFLHRSQAAAEAAHAHIEELRRHAAEREAEIARLHAHIHALHISPIRQIAVLMRLPDRLLRGLLRRLRGPR